MGKGDKKTKRGKLFSGSYGRLRPRKKQSGNTIVKPAAKKRTSTSTAKVQAMESEKAAETLKTAVEEPVAKPEEKPAEKPAEKTTAAPKDEKQEPKQ